MPRLTGFDWSPLGTGPWPRAASPAVSPLPAAAEHVIIGGGLTGLSCALNLAVAGHDVVVLDRTFGCGATSRSGGIIIGETLVGPVPGFDGCELELRAWVDRHGIDGGLDWCGVLELDRNPSLPDHPIDWRDSGMVRLDQVAPGGILDPSALLARVAAEAVQHGARLVDAADVKGLSRRGSSIEVLSSAGSVHASRVLVATDATATANHFEPWPVRQITVALETTPLGDDQVAAMGWRERQPFYTNKLPLLWGRGLPGGGMIAGRELLDSGGMDPARLEQAIRDAGRRLIARVRGLHPALQTVAPLRTWAGPIARDDRGIPNIRLDPDLSDVFWAGGYGGHGLAQAFRLGAIAALRMSER